MVLPEPFTTASPIIASFSSSEFSTGLNFQKFYCMANTDNSGTTHTLIDDSSLYSDPAFTTGEDYTLTFDTSGFNMPRTIKGTAILNLGFATTAGLTGTITVQLKKIDNTAITSAIVKSFGASEQTVKSISMPCTETLIPEGEGIRLVVISASNGPGVIIGHDPIGRPGAGAPTISDSNINIPFKIDL